MDNPEGCQIFKGLAQYLQLSVDQFNFIASQIAALGAATLFRTLLHPSKTTPASRQTIGLVLGLLMAYFCYGRQIVHLASLPALCYAIITTQNANAVHLLVLATAMIYLSCLHIHRQFYEFVTPGLDITGPLMVITQKVTSLAFNLHDGLTKDERDMTKIQKRYAITKPPDLLDYFSYTLFFSSLMAGPVIYYKDYIEFITGNNYACYTKGMKQSRRLIEPSPARTVCRKVLLAISCAFIFVKFLPQFPITRVKDANFVENTSTMYKFWYLTVSTTLVRFKYYFAWTFADAVCNNCGLGFEGFNDDGSSNWNQVTNVDIFKFEFAKSIKESIDAWNMGTNTWLRMIVYERTGRYATVLTYALSAVWHGFYPGYYLTFATGALFTFAARVVRQRIRPHFTHNFESRLFYDIVTFIVTHLALAYCTFPFVLLEFWASIHLYHQMFWCVHIIAFLFLFFVPRLFARPTTTSSKLSNNISQSYKQPQLYYASIKNGVDQDNCMN